MKAIRLHPGGGADALRREEVPSPIPGPCDVLVRVHAVAVSAAELTPPATEGQARPPSIPGRELSGVVESVPGKVSGIAVGDAVYGLADPRRDGAAADYVCVRASNLAPKPRTVDHVGAAAMVLAGLTAWQGLFDHARLASGQRVLILGAAGAVGAVAVQLAHWRRAHVIGTACARHRDFLRGLGADEVIDPTSARFDDKGWDADLDWGATPTGRDRPGPWSLRRRPLTLDGVRVISFTVEPNRAQLVELARLVDGERGTSNGPGPRGCCARLPHEPALGLEEGEAGNVAEVPGVQRPERGAARPSTCGHAEVELPLARARHQPIQLGGQGRLTRAERQSLGRRQQRLLMQELGLAPWPAQPLVQDEGWRSRCVRPDRALRAAPERSAAVRSARRPEQRCRDGSPTPRGRPAPAPAAA